MNTITKLYEAIESGTAPPPEIFTEDVVFDATVPDWRFRLHDAEALSAQLGGWFPCPGQFEQLDRTPIPDGELVEFVITFEERGIPYTVHQVHIVRVRDGRIAHMTAFCGGRWSAARMAEMGAAASAG